MPCVDPHLFFVQEYYDPRDADDAVYYMNGRDVAGSRITVEFARRVSFYLGVADVLLGASSYLSAEIRSLLTT